MTTKSDVAKVPVRGETHELELGTPQPVDTGKKVFVEPEVSNAVDVLEATTFFQGVDSGATN